MKKLFISMLAIAALASCAKEEVIVADQGELIGFNSFVENSTRADYSSTDINTINVYGTVSDVLIYDYTAVTRPSNQAGQGYNTAWTCLVTQYWIEGADYKFAALVDVPKANITHDEFGMPASFTYKADGVTDVLYDYYATTGLKENNPIVPFTFKHLLSKAYFTVKNSATNADYTYSISNVKVTNTLPSGTYTVYVTDEGTGSWASTATATPTVFASIEDVAANGATKTNAEILLIPGATVGVSFDVTLKIGGDEVRTYPYSKTGVVTLAQNTVYNFGIELKPGELIEFTVTDQPEWDTPTTDVTL